MKANELRIGNLVKINEIELALTSALFCLVIDGQTAPIKPIPITEEWLLKFGFSFGIKLQSFAKGKYQFIDKNGFFGDFSEDCIFYFSLKTKLEYVHQLQNLYFALTNEELNIK